MQGLNTMIRLSRFQLDEKKRKLAELRELSQQIQLSLDALEAERQMELQTAQTEGNLDFMRAFEEYRVAAEQRKATLMQSIAEIEDEVTNITSEIAEAFQELKRYELTIEERARKTALKAKRRESNLLDEFGLNAFRRKSG